MVTSNETEPSERRLERAKLRHATFIDPRTGVRSKRSFILASQDNVFTTAEPPSDEDPTTFARGYNVPPPPATRWDRFKIKAKEKTQVCKTFVTSDLGQGMFKCALAYLLGSMYTFIPFFNLLLDKTDSKHVAATITVYFHPARTRGSALKALVIASIAFIYTAVIGLASMAVTVLFIDKLHQIAIGHFLVLVFFVGGGLGFVGWVKLTHGDPLINIACSLTNLSLISVLTKEGAVQAGDFSFEKIGQYLRMIVAGVIASTLVSLFVLPVSARRLFKKNMVQITDDMSDMLGIITSSFISGDQAEIEGKKLTALRKSQQKVENNLKTNLADARIELNVLGYEEEAHIQARMLQCVQRIAQGIGGLRSAAAMQFIVVNQPYVEHNSSKANMDNSYTSLTASPARTPTLERFPGIGTHFDQIFGQRSSTAPSTPTKDGSTFEMDLNRFKNHKQQSTDQIFELFIEHLGPSMRSLAFTLKEILDDLPFEPEEDYAISNNPRFRVSLERALALYKESRKGALETVYDKKNMDRNRPLELEADWEEAAACCGQFSYCLLAVAEQIKEYLVILDDLEGEVEERPLGRTWEWLKFWKKEHRHHGIANSKELQQKAGSDHELVGDFRINKVKPRQNAYDQSVQAGHIHMNLKQQVLRKLYDALSFLRREDKKFFIKVGFGAMLYALPSFIAATRPIYTRWKGEWGLLSYMLVCSMTIGASNTTGWQRTWGTCLGAGLAIVAWHLCGGHAVPLAIFGFIMAYWTAYVILGMGKGPLGRFIMLTYNLSALYAYNVLVVPPSRHNDEEDGSDTPKIFTIALHRTVAVISGCIWGLIITRVVWPLSARRKLKDGLALLWLRMALIWRRDPLAVFSQGEAQESYMNLREEIDLQAFMGKLNSLVAASKNEFVLRRPFPAETYARILAVCSRMLDSFHQMHIVIEKDMNASPGEQALLEATVRERDELCARLSHQFSVLASSMKLEYSIANAALPSVGVVRDRLLARIFAYRKGDAEEQKTSDEDYSLLYTYALVTGQVGKEIQSCLKEIEGLFGVLDEESLVLE